MWITAIASCVTPDGVTGPVDASPKNFKATLKEAIEETKAMAKQYSKGVHLYIGIGYKDQCSICFDKEELDLIHSTGVELHLDVWEEE